MNIWVPRANEPPNAHLTWTSISWVWASSSLVSLSSLVFFRGTVKKRYRHCIRAAGSPDAIMFHIVLWVGKIRSVPPEADHSLCFCTLRIVMADEKPTWAFYPRECSRLAQQSCKMHWAELNTLCCCSCSQDFLLQLNCSFGRSALSCLWRPAVSEAHSLQTNSSWTNSKAGTDRVPFAITVQDTAAREARYAESTNSPFPPWLSTAAVYYNAFPFLTYWITAHTSNYRFYKCKWQFLNSVSQYLVSSHLHHGCTELPEKSQCVCLAHSNHNKNQHQTNRRMRFVTWSFASMCATKNGNILNLWKTQVSSETSCWD